MTCSQMAISILLPSSRCFVTMYMRLPFTVQIYHIVQLLDVCSKPAISRRSLGHLSTLPLTTRILRCEHSKVPHIYRLSVVLLLILSTQSIYREMIETSNHSRPEVSNLIKCSTLLPEDHKT
ncbi:hypothetical protein M758_1G129100 [Ceratodon purpureus]|nr:hypothetical protein M758_1G129100 [Ceratodon purpureus]